MKNVISKPLLGKKVAVLVANGFNEQDVTALQEDLQSTGAAVRIISMEDHGLAHSWNGTGWGLHFAGDALLKSALPADFSMLAIPGGQRSIEKLKLTTHTRRFIAGFLDMGKPVAVFGGALDLLVFSEQISGRRVSGPARLQEQAKAKGAKWMDIQYVADDNLITGRTGDDRKAYSKAVVEHFISCYNRNPEFQQYTQAA